jgi:hypothetical protein
MLCTACGSPLAYKGGENREDWGCWNFDGCGSRLERSYYGNVKVRDGWWFSAGYALPFRWNDEWYCAVGPSDDKTVFQKLHSPTIAFTILDVPYYMDDAWQEFLLSIPYYALPVNDDFNAQFDILKAKFIQHRTRPSPNRFANLLLDE